ncbi:hypothetical protein Tco_1254466 [Tanacetum coccineum]
MLAPSGGGLILYQAYDNLYAMTGRKAHLLKDKQILSVGVLDEDEENNRRNSVPQSGFYPCHIEEKMTIKEVRGESVMKWKIKVTTKEGIVIKFPGKFRWIQVSNKEEVEENEGLKEVWEQIEYVISDSDSDLESTASS